MKYEFNVAECTAFGQRLHASGLRLDSDTVKASIVTAASGKYYVSSKTRTAYKASLVVAGYWESVNGAQEVKGLDI